MAAATSNIYRTLFFLNRAQNGGLTVCKHLNSVWVEYCSKKFVVVYLFNIDI